MSLYRHNTDFATLDLLLHELLPFARIQFSILFSAIFSDNDLKFGNEFVLMQ